jgi:hypothetical protein
MGRESLGEFEKVVLLAILQLGGESYGAPILDEIERRAGQTPSSGTLYVALRRLERRGLLSVAAGPRGSFASNPKQSGCCTGHRSSGVTWQMDSARCWRVSREGAAGHSHPAATAAQG